MKILVAGVRQKNASIEIRERFALTDEQVDEAMLALKEQPGILECTILTTCNRTEIYTVVEETDIGIDSIKRFFREFKGVDFDLYRLSVFTLLHEDAILHLFRVASGLDSLIVGEGQILGQVKDTYAKTQRLKTGGVILDRLFQSAISVGKRVRTDTGIASKDVSVSRAAYSLVKKLEPGFADQKIALIGGGKMATMLMGALKHDLSEAQQTNITVVNRSETRLKALREKYGYHGVGWDQVSQAIAASDILFVATGAPHVVLQTHHFEETTAKLIMDISVPRNVAPQVGDLDHVSLYNTDDLEGEGQASFSPERQREILEMAHRIIDDEYAVYYQWYVSLSAVPTITELRSKVESIRRAQLQAYGALPNAEAAALEEMSRGLVNKILHEPTVRLRSAGNTPEEIASKAELLGQLFNLGESQQS